MEARGVDMPNSDIQPPIPEDINDKVKKDFSLLKGHEFFDGQFRDIKSKFLEYLKVISEFKKEHNGATFHVNLKRNRKQKENLQDAINVLNSERKEKNRIINNHALSKGEKEELERELRKLEVEIKIVKEQLKTRPHDSEILGLVRKFERAIDAFERLGPNPPKSRKERLESDIQTARDNLLSPKYQKADSLVTKLVKDYPRFVKMLMKFNNSNATPKVVSAAKSRIFDLDKKLKVKQREYDKVESKISSMVDSLNQLNSTVEGYNDKAMDKFKSLLLYTADMMSKDSGNLDADQISRLENLKSGDETSNPVLNIISGFNRDYDGSTIEGLNRFEVLPFNELIKLVDSSKVVKTPSKVKPKPYHLSAAAVSNKRKPKEPNDLDKVYSMPKGADME